jgi:hypothetical protein
LDETWTWTAGAVMYQKVQASDAAPWQNFGRSVTISGDYAVVGAIYPAMMSSTRRGAVYIFQKIGGVWTEIKKILGTQNNGSLGHSVGICGDYIVIGEPRFILPNGRVYIYHLSGGVWSLQQTIIGGLGFGINVSVGVDRFIVSGWCGTLRRAYAYVRSGITWSLEYTFPIGIGPNFQSLCCNYDCSKIILGDGDYDVFYYFGGRALFYTRSGSTYTLEQTIYGQSAYERFGNVCGIKNNDAIIGCVYYVKIYVYAAGSWSLQQTIPTSAVFPDTDVCENYCLFSDTDMIPSTLYLYTRSGVVWTEKQQLTEYPHTFGSGIEIDKNDNTSFIVNIVGIEDAYGAVCFYKTED